MNGTIGVLRAVSSAFAQTLIRKFGLIAGAIWLVLLLLCVLLITQVSGWWALLLGPVIVVGLITAAFAGVLWFAAQRLAPRKLSTDERKEITAFSDKILSVAERVKTPLPVLATMTAKDILLRRDSNTVRELINESTSLKADFQALLAKYS